MTRYKIVYSKRGGVMATWESTPDEARARAQLLREAGYSVDIWECTDTGARPWKEA